MIGELLVNLRRLMIEVEKLDLAQSLNYVLTLQFVDKLEKDSKIDKEERYRLQDEIETKKGRPKCVNVVEDVKKELRRMQVFDNQGDMWKSTTHDMHYIQRDMEGRDRVWKETDIQDQIQGRDFR